MAGATVRVYRASSLGYSLEQLVAPHLGYEPVSPPDFLQRAYDEGNRIEPLAIQKLRDKGWFICDEQLEVEIQVSPTCKIVGHLDGTGHPQDLPWGVVEIKSMAAKTWETFKRLGWEAGGLIEKYKWQASAYMLATNKPHYMIGWNKDTEELHVEYVSEPFYPYSELVAKVEEAEKYVVDGVLPEGCTDYPCLTAGTLVFTERGYRPIESLAVGDRVLTHTGAWRPILTLGSRHASTRMVRAYGSTPVSTTDEHPFLTRLRWYHHYKNGFPAIRKFKEATWIDAKDLTKDTFIGQILPPVDEDNLEALLTDNELWLVGRYLADGWRNDSQKQVYICCAKAEEQELSERIQKANYKIMSYHDKATVRFRLPGEFFDVVRGCGKLAHGKKLAMWILTLSPERARHVLDGYLSGDGHLEPKNQKWIFSTASKELALGMGLLVQRATGKPCSLVISKRNDTCVIEGRTVNQRIAYVCTLQYTTPKGSRFRNPAAFVEDGIAWKPMNVSRPTGLIETVYNIQVADDESYMVENMIVHNCPYFYLHENKDAVPVEQADDKLEELLADWLHIDRQIKQLEKDRKAIRDEIVGESTESLAAGKVKGVCGVTVSTTWVEAKHVEYDVNAHWETRIQGPRNAAK